MTAMPSGASQKSYSMQDAGYMGPGARKHVYEFEVYALKTATFAPKTPGDQREIYKELQDDTAKIVLASSIIRARSPD